MKHIDQKSINDILLEYHKLSKEAKAGRPQGEYPSPHPGLHALLGAMEVSGFIETFDWMTWVESIGADNLNSISYLKTADLETYRKLMSAHIRLERFSAGHIQKLFTSGYMHAFFEGLENI